MKKIVISEEFKARAQAQRALRAKTRGTKPLNNSHLISKSSSNWNSSHNSNIDNLPDATVIKYNPNYKRKTQ